MPRGDGVVREIVWKDICPWLILVRALKIAAGLRMLVLAAIALWLISAGWWAAGKAFQGSNDALLQIWIKRQTSWPWQAAVQRDSLESLSIRDTILTGPLFEMWSKYSAPFVHLFEPNQSVAGLAYSLLCCLWALLILGLFGGAIARIAALDLTREESIGWRPALEHSWSKLGSYIMAPLLPLGAVLLGILFLSIPALLMRLDFGVLLAGFLWPLVLLAGLLMTIVLVGVWLGWPLMIATLAVESSESFDALNRAYAYVYQRPLRFLFYVFVASVLGLIGSLLIFWFTELVLYFSELAVSWGAGSEQMRNIRRWSLDDNPPGHMVGVGATMIRFWRNCVYTVAHGFQLAFFLTAATGIYLLLRRSVDAVELDEVYLDEDQAYGLPSLEKDAAGVPGVPDAREISEPAEGRGSASTDVAGDE
jgi:hypothetical protein